MESLHEIDGLRYWAGDPTVLVLQADQELNAMLLEACEPGTSLRTRPEEEQDQVVARLLQRCWRRPSDPHPFRPLSAQMAHWAEETTARSSHWRDAGLVRKGLHLFEELSASSPDDVLLPTDLHAGNALRSEREGWLLIDPKPFVGDRAYDVTQHLLNCPARMQKDPQAAISRMSDLLGIDPMRVRLWLFARLAAEPREVSKDHALVLARRLAK